jgi:hypothetical protein
MSATPVCTTSSVFPGKRALRLVAAVLLSVGLTLPAGCLTEPEERALTIDLVVEESTVSLADSAVFTLTAGGPSLVTAEVTFGDGEVFSDDLFGAVETQRRITHLYDQSGQYTVVAEVMNQDSSVVNDEVTVQVESEP